MSETKPQKRLVSKGRYIWITGKKGFLHTLMLMFVCIGVGLGLLFVSMFFEWMGTLSKEIHPDLRPPYGLFGLLCGGLSCLSCLCFLYFRKTARAVESVRPITDHNAHLLPAEETLLRGSDLPPTAQQAELLRATQAAQETPQEELLRATTGEE